MRQTQTIGAGISLDSNALEQERGITIYAKNTSIIYKGTKINIVDTPGHAAFSGIRERSALMADLAIVVVSAEEGVKAQTLEAITPQLDEVSSHLTKSKEEIAQIDPNRYPSTIAGKPIRANIIKLQQTLDAGYIALTEAKPFISLLPKLLGQDSEKTYMILFQNDAELRPTGGFMTAYAYIKVNKGKITPLDSYDIYDLDARWNRKLPAPEPIKKYLPLVNNWNLRDMNLSPDFKTSMDIFYKQ